ncbi:MAG: hypothetical protein AAGJ10_18990 [Bacteroidota bacterium]
MQNPLKRTLIAFAATVITAVVYVLLSGPVAIDNATDLLPALVVGVIVFLMPTLKRKGTASS